MSDFEFEDYDFSFSEDASSMPPPISRPKFVAAEPRFSSRESIARKSTTERAEEILRRSAATREVAKEEENFSSIASSWDNIMKDFKVEDFDDNVVTASVDANPQENEDGLLNTTTSMSEDSFELSAADFEVGTIASKRMEEKARLRSSVTSPSSSMPLKMVSSPEVAKV